MKVTGTNLICPLYGKKYFVLKLIWNVGHLLANQKPG